MAWVSNVVGHLQRYLAKIAGLLVLVALLFSTSCSKPQTGTSPTVKPALFPSRPMIKQVESPRLIRELTPWLDTYEPQVQIRQPQAEQVFDDTTVSIVLRSQDLPIYKDKIWDLGPHVQLLLDNQPYASIYDIEQPIVLDDLTPGTHTIRAFATRPWSESFKNEGAYDQVTFHVLAKTDENSPASDQPLLTYAAPIGTYGAEPVLLDFYLSDTPLHQVAQTNPNISDWQVRYTINGDSFTVKDWQPIYIEGLTPGPNWVQVALIDDEGNPIEGVFNNTVRLIEYDPSLNDGLAKIIRGDLTLEEVGSIVDPTYEPPAPEIPEPAAPSISEDSAEDNGLEMSLDSEPAAPDLTKPELIEPETGEPETGEPELIEPKTDEPVIPEAAESEQINAPKLPAAPVLLDAEDSALKQSPPSFVPDDSVPEQLETADRPNEIKDGSEEIDIEESPLEENLVAPALDAVKPDRVPPLNQESQTVDTLDGAADSVPTASVSEPRVEASKTETNTAETGAEAEMETPNSEDVTSPRSRYLQRLYDYSDRALNANERDR